MYSDRRIAALLGLAVVMAGFGLAYISGIGPLDEDPAEGLEKPGNSSEDIEPDPGRNSSVVRGGISADAAAFSMEVTNMTRCGQACREVTTKLTNKMVGNATDVVVYTRIYAGESTSDDDLVWAENRDVGTIPAGGVDRNTDRIELSYQKGREVQDENGDVTMETIVESDQETVTFVMESNVYTADITLR